jgi:PRTRC genetic system protein C
MKATVTTTTRAFLYNGRNHGDPAPALAPDAVRQFLARDFPELHNAAIEGPEQVGDALHYRFAVQVGKKG